MIVFYFGASGADMIAHPTGRLYLSPYIHRAEGYTVNIYDQGILTNKVRACPAGKILSVVATRYSMVGVGGSELRGFASRGEALSAAPFCINLMGMLPAHP